MDRPELLRNLAEKKISVKQLSQQVDADLSLLPVVLEGTSSPNPRVKYGCAKILSNLSEDAPEKLYSRMDFFIELLDSREKILKWNALDILANLAKVDAEKKFDRIFGKYYSFLQDEAMITVAHVVDNSGKIAKARPDLAKEITDRLLRVERLSLTQHLTQECKNILLGKTIVAFGTYLDRIERKDDVTAFVKRQLQNSRNATRVKAEKFLRQVDS
jgi:hypothetical protein